MNKCINCGYFLNCGETEENKTECKNFIKKDWEVKKYDDNNKSK